MIYTWLKQIPRWLRSFPCILFSLPGPSGHFPFLPAVPLPARLISLSDPVLPRRTVPSLQLPRPACHGHPCSPKSSHTHGILSALQLQLTFACLQVLQAEDSLEGHQQKAGGCLPYTSQNPRETTFRKKSCSISSWTV